MLSTVILLLLMAAALIQAARLVTMTMTKSISLDGVQGSEVTTATGESGVKANQTLAVAKSGTLSTRTSNTAGTLTMESGHGITTGARLDIYWTNTDGTAGHAYGATVGTVSGLSVPFTGAAGDVMPAAATAVTASVPNDAVFGFVGDDMKGLLLSTTVAGYFVVADGSGNLLAQYVAANSSYSWIYGSGVTNPLAGDTPTKIYMSQSGITSSVTQAYAAAVVA